MSIENEKIFRDKYPDYWLKSKKYRAEDISHYRYQEITIDHLNCFPGCSLIECGCGSGELLSRLSQKYSGIRLFGIDLGRKSIISARSGPLKQYNYSFIEGDISSLPVKTNSFDRVLSSSVLWYLPDPYHAIMEMIRILKPGGQFVFDVRNPFHITNLLTQWSLAARRGLGRSAFKYSFLSPRSLSGFLESLPIKFSIFGYFVLLPTRLPVLGRKWGNLAALSTWLSFKAGHGMGRWLSQKLLVSGYKLSSEYDHYKKYN